MPQKRKVLIQLNACMLCLLFLMLVSPIVAATSVANSEMRKLLAKARQATDKYHDVNIALADGYISTIECVEIPEVGGMRIHFVNPALTNDLVVDELTPELLLYVETEEGLKLVGVEYFVMNADQPTPELFGHSLEVLCLDMHLTSQNISTCMFGYGKRTPMEFLLH